MKIKMKPRLNAICRVPSEEYTRVIDECAKHLYDPVNYADVGLIHAMNEPAHNECPVCGKHLPDNVGACRTCIKRAAPITRRFMFWVWGDQQNLAGALDAIHDQRREPMRYWPK